MAEWGKRADAVKRSDLVQAVRMSYGIVREALGNADARSQPESPIFLEAFRQTLGECLEYEVTNDQATDDREEEGMGVK